jgi:acetyl-CoA carboxylase biotin carboxyl carrier protein
MQVDVVAEMTASVWKVAAKPGDVVEASDEVVTLESMKMEIPVMADHSGVIVEVLVAEGDVVNEGQTLLRIETG